MYKRMPMGLNLVLILVSSLLNNFRSPVTAATAVTGASAGATILLTKPPETTADWVIVIAGAIGLIANTLHANLLAAKDGK